ncbi:MAG: threonine--tRNA ligase [Chloroflexi bacterium]|nr:MAG: threonine--tRNA ligase [Chloroflexota bacterium]
MDPSRQERLRRQARRAPIVPLAHQLSIIFQVHPDIEASLDERTLGRADIPAGLQRLRAILRHSTAHVMAAAVLDLFPGTVIGIGPATDEGFYYDFGFKERLLPEQLPKIEARMREIIKAAPPFTKEELPRTDAVALFERLHQPLKVELIADKVIDATARIYRTGDFVDLCLGPHVANAGLLGAFRLLSIAGAYWKGSEKNQQLTRIYGTAFPTQEQLDTHLKMLEDAAKRDHRKLGKELDLFLIDEMVGRGLPLLTPKGATIRRQMEEFILRLERRQGYEHVKTPDIARLDIYKISGHFERYRDSMYAPSEMEEEQWQLRPMNCPHHIRVFQRKAYSFRELPVRIAELGTVYRYEKSGEVSGLIRVRAFTINDAHIFCRPDQLNDEFERVIELILQVYRAFGITDFYFRLSLRDDSSNKWMGDPAVWQRAQDAAREALRASGHPFVEATGEAAFYGPKLDVQIKDAIGREFSLSTNQIDFLMPERFGLEYVTSTQEMERPVMIHRAPIGSMERFMAYVIERYAGAFPVWLAPVQVVFIPIADRHVEAVAKLADRFRQRDLRVEVDGRSERMQAKIRDAQLQKVPYMAVVGDKELEAGTLNIRRREGGDQVALGVEDFLRQLEDESRLPL